MKKIEINEVEYNIPESFEDISFGEFEELLIMLEEHPSSPKITHDLALDVIQFLTKIDKQLMLECNELVYKYVYSTIQFAFFQESLKEIPLKLAFNIGGILHECSNDPNCTTKEYVDRDEVLNNFPKEKKLSGMIAIFLRPISKEYNSKDLEERINLIKKEKTTEIYPLIAFFLAKRELCQRTMKVYSMALHLTQGQMEELNSYLKSGDGTGSLWSWRKRTCLYLMSYLKDRYSKCLTYYHTLQTKISPHKIN